MRKLYSSLLKEIIFFLPIFYFTQLELSIFWSAQQFEGALLPGLGSGTFSAFCVIATLYLVYENVVCFYLPRVASRNATFMLQTPKRLRNAGDESILYCKRDSSKLENFFIFSPQ